MIHYIDNLKHLVDFELFYGNVDNLKILLGDNLDYIKTKIKDLALTSLLNYSVITPQHLSNEEFEGLKNLSAIWNSIIQKGDKGNPVVLVEKDVYIRNIEKILDNATKFEKMKVKKGILNFSINYERCILYSCTIYNYLKSRWEQQF